MFKREDFDVSFVGEGIHELIGDVGVLENKNDLDEVSKKIDSLADTLKRVTWLPRFSLTKTFYIDEETGNIDKAVFLIRPTKDENFGLDLRKRFTLIVDEDFYKNFLNELIEWFETYEFNYRLMENVKELNNIVASIVEENNIKFKFEFTVGEGVYELTDTSIVVGIPVDVVMNFDSLPLFDENFESRREGYKNLLTDLLLSCVRPYDLVRTPNRVTKDLGIFTLKSMHRLLRQIVTRRIDVVRVGVGYYDDGENFAVISKVPVPDNYKEIGEDELIIENSNPSAKESEEGLGKLLVKYVVKPFNKKTGDPVDISLSEAI